MGFWDDLKDDIRDSVNEANEKNSASCKTTCQRCGKWCNHLQKGITMTMQPIYGSTSTCSNCGAQQIYDGDRWRWNN